VTWGSGGTYPCRTPDAAAERVPFAPVFNVDEPPLAIPVLEASAARRAGEHED
jgi:hypothetical protein